MKSTFDAEEAGWEDGQRVPLAGDWRRGPWGVARGDGSRANSEHDAELWGDEGLGGSDGTRVGGGGWWPSEEVPMVELAVLSREEAGSVSAGAREGMFLWMAGAGLHPTEVLARYALGCARLRPGAGLVGEMLRSGLRGPAWERWVMEGMFPGRNWRRSWNGVQDVLRTLARQGRYQVLRDDRSLEEVMDWVAGESGEWGASGEAEARVVAVLAMGGLLDWLGEDGGGVLQVVQRFYGLLFERYQGSLGVDLSGSDLMGLTGQVRATFCELTNRLFEEPLEVRLGYRPKVSGQKCAEASEAYAENARRHKPRRQLGGGAGLEGEEGRALAGHEQAAREAAALARLEKDRVAAEKRRVEREAREMEELARRNAERARARRREKGGFSE